MLNTLNTVRMTRRSFLDGRVLFSDCRELSENLEWLGENLDEIVLTNVSAIYLTPSLVKHWRFTRVKKITFFFSQPYSRMNLAGPVADRLILMRKLNEATQVWFLGIKDPNFELLKSVTDKIKVGCVITYKGP